MLYKQRQDEMNLIDTDTVKPFVNATLHALDLVAKHIEANNEHGIIVELFNAQQELKALKQLLEEHLEEPRRMEAES